MAADEIKIKVGGDVSELVKASQKATSAMDDIGAEAQNAGIGLKDLVTSLIGPIGLGTALTVVTGMMAKAVEKYGSLDVALDALIQGNGNLRLANMALADSFSEAQGKAAGEVAEINALLSIAKNEELSKAARAEAMNKLNKEYDEFLPKLTLENVNTQAVTDAVNKLTEARIRQAKIKGVEGLISKETEKQAELYAELVDQVKNGDKGFQGLVNRLKNLPQANSGISGLNVEMFKLTQQMQESEERANVFNEALKNLLTTDANAGTLFTGEKTEKIKKGADALQLQISALEKLKKALDDVKLDSTDVAEKLIGLKIKITLRDAGKNSLSKEEVDLQVKSLNAQLQEAFNKQQLRFEAITRVKPSIAFERVDIQKEIQSAIAKATGFDKAIPTVTIQEVRVNILGIKLGTAINQAEAIKQQLQDTIFNSLQQGIADGSNVIGELFGNLLSGDSAGSALANAAQGLLGIVGGILQQIGVQIIATSTAVAALKKALNGLFGPGGETIGLAVGVGLVALGGLIKGIKFDVPKFADGGIVTKPTLGMFGEAGPEAIFPLSKLNDFVGGGNSNITLQPSVRVSGTDLLILLERAGERKRRLG